MRVRIFKKHRKDIVCKFSILLIMLTVISPVKAQDIDSLFRAVDRALDSQSIYIDIKLNTIASLRKQLNSSVTPRQRYDECVKLYEAYEKFQNDSAAEFLHRCISIADEMQSATYKTECLLRLVKQYSYSGYYAEAIQYLKAIDRSAVSTETLPLYHETVRILYGEMGRYTHDTELRQYYFDISDRHRDTLFTLLPEHSVTYLSLQENLKVSQHDYVGAMVYNDELLRLVPPTSAQFATVAFFRALEYGGLQQSEQQKRWLALSALCDIKNSVMDQASLWTLAEILDREGQRERSCNYVEYSWTCTLQFSARLRTWAVSPVVSKISYNQNERLKKNNTRLMWMLIAASILAVIVVILYLSVSRKRRQLTIARQELHLANEKLVDINTQLSLRNEDLTTLNSQLTESNLIKEEYIGQFFSICSEYIEKLEQQRITVARKVKAHQFDDLLRLSQDAKLKEKDIEELNTNFDMVFLHLFPNFVSEFNALLQPEHRIEQTDAMRLPIVIRIYALVRLGIGDSYHIAQFLHLTPNTIYNYRSRMRQKAIIRDTFDDDVLLTGK